MTPKKYGRFQNLAQCQAAFAEKGIYAMYGGRKGHGFWLYNVGKVEALILLDLPILEFGKYFNQLMGKFILSPIIKNDGMKSGNPCFWLIKNAIALLDASIYERDNHFAETKDVSVFFIRSNGVNDIFAVKKNDGGDPEYVQYPRSMEMTARAILEGLPER